MEQVKFFVLKKMTFIFICNFSKYLIIQHAGFGGVYFQSCGDDGSAEVSKDGKSFLEGYKSILNSKNSEESLVSLASLH